jgi:hypothetical protein
MAGYMDSGKSALFCIMQYFIRSVCYDCYICYYYYYYYYYYYCYHLYSAYLHLHTGSKPRHYGTQCCGCSLFTVCATCNVISHVQCVLYFDISTSRSLCVVPNVAVFCSSLVSCFAGMLLRYCLSDSEVVPVALLSLLLSHCTRAEFLL